MHAYNTYRSPERGDWHPATKRGRGETRLSLSLSLALCASRALSVCVGCLFLSHGFARTKHTAKASTKHNEHKTYCPSKHKTHCHLFFQLRDQKHEGKGFFFAQKSCRNTSRCLLVSLVINLVAARGAASRLLAFIAPPARSWSEV